MQANKCQKELQVIDIKERTDFFLFSASFQCCATCCWLKRNLCHAHRNNNVLAASLVESAKQNQVNNFDLRYTNYTASS